MKRIFDHNKWVFILETNHILLLVASFLFNYHDTDWFLSIPLTAFLETLMPHLHAFSHLSAIPSAWSGFTYSKSLIDISETELDLKSRKLQVLQDKSKDPLDIYLS